METIYLISTIICIYVCTYVCMHAWMYVCIRYVYIRIIVNFITLQVTSSSMNNSRVES